MRRTLVVLIAGAAILVAVAVGAVLWATSSDSSPTLKSLSSLGPLDPAPDPGRPSGELVPIPDAPPLAKAGSVPRPGKSLDGIECEHNPRLVEHHHVHLTLFVEGEARQVPAGVGIWPPLGPQNYRNGQFGQVGNCLSWLNTRYADGLIHVEAAVERSFVLGEFFDVWGQPLGPSEVGPARGEVTATVNGKVWTGDPREIPLERHAQIQLQVGRPLVEPQVIRFPGAF
ncbi:MAG TPA: hypothetical protein VH721_07125 [Gaiellaceae bacterium]